MLLYFKQIGPDFLKKVAFTQKDKEHTRLRVCTYQDITYSTEKDKCGVKKKKKSTHIQAAVTHN